MFVNPTSSNAWTALSADSDKASGDGQPYLSSSGRSSDPPLTPTRKGIPRSFTALMTSSTFHQAPMLPGLIRTQSTISAAFNANRWSKWISAISGTVIAALILGSTAAASHPARPRESLRTRPLPAGEFARSSPRHRACRSNTSTGPTPGASPPILTWPTRICRVFRLCDVHGVFVR